MVLFIFKVKGIRLNILANQLITLSDMEEQVFNLQTKKRHVGDEDDKIVEPAAKRSCLEGARQSLSKEWGLILNTLYKEQGGAKCNDSRPDSLPIQGPCNCSKCAKDGVINVPQVLFKRIRNEGCVTTIDIHKKYRLVLSKRWLDANDDNFVTRPFGYGL